MENSKQHSRQNIFNSQSRIAMKNSTNSKSPDKGVQTEKDLFRIINDVSNPLGKTKQ